MSFVTSGEADFPNFSEFFSTNDSEKKSKIIQDAVSKVLSSRIVPQIDKVRDNQTIFFGESGLIVHKAASIPDDINWMVLAIESDKNTRDNAKLLNTLLERKQIDSIAASISTIVKASSPVAMAISALTSIIADSIIKVFSEDKDDQVGLFISSLIKSEHYPHGKRDAQNIPDSTGNMFLDYTIFAY